MELFAKNSVNFRDYESIEITSSSSWNFNQYTISIAEGTYEIGKDGTPQNLKYKVKINN